MKIAILTSGVLPVPAVQGGAVENLVDFYLEYNDQHKMHDITVYSVWHPDVRKHPAQASKVNHYKYIRTDGWWSRLKKTFYLRTHGYEYYHHAIEYFLHEAIKDIRRQHYDAIILENRPGYALKLREVSQAKFIYHLHNDHLNDSSPEVHTIYNIADRIITVSDYIKRGIINMHPHDHKTTTVHNGIDLAAFSSAKGNGIRPQRDFTIVFSGRISEEKGILELIEAMLLLKDYPNIRLLVIGNCSYGNNQDKNDFTKTVNDKAIALKDRIIFTGFVPYHEIPSYLRTADVAIIPSIWNDPFPTTVLEAQAMGLPIITTNRGGIPEEVTPENAIILDVNKYFVETLASAILDLYKHTEKRSQMAKASLKRAKLFDKETYAKNFFAAITDSNSQIDTE